MKRFQDEFPNLVVLDARRSGYGGAAFWDPIHLTRSGSATLSTDVAATIAGIEHGQEKSVAHGFRCRTTARWTSKGRLKI